MDTSVYSFNKHSFRTCVGQALGDVGVSETGPLHAGVHRWGEARKDTHNYKWCIMCAELEAGPERFTGSKEEEVNILANEGVKNV